MLRVSKSGVLLTLLISVVFRFPLHSGFWVLEKSLGSICAVIYYFCSFHFVAFSIPQEFEEKGIYLLGARAELLEETKCIVIEKQVSF